MVLRVLKLLVLEEADAEEVGDEDDALFQHNRIMQMQNSMVALIVILERIPQLLHKLTFNFGVVVVDFGWTADFGGEEFLFILHVSALEHLSVFSALDGADNFVSAGDLDARSEYLNDIWIQILVLALTSFAFSSCAIGVPLVFSQLIAIQIAFIVNNKARLVRLGGVRFNILILVEISEVRVVF